MKKFRVYCETDNKWECVLSDVLPTECPTDSNHTLRSDSQVIDEEGILVNDGTPVSAQATLDAYKQLRYNEIDYKTGLLISAGFTFDNETFSTSGSAQINWSSIKANKDDYTFPLDISTKDNGEYSLAEADVVGFWTAGRDYVLNHLNSGRSLKASIKSATDRAGVDAILDNR